MSSEYTVKSNIVWGDIDLSDYNAFAFYCNIFDRPERDVDVVSIPGRNGDLIFDNGRYKNIDRVYQVQVNGVQNAKNLLSALATQRGYNRLDDDYDSNVYMEARLKSQPVITRFVGDSTSITLTFDRKPQRFLLQDTEGIQPTEPSGVAARNITNPNGAGTVNALCFEFVIDNQTEHETRPYIYVPNQSTLPGMYIIPSENRLTIEAGMTFPIWCVYVNVRSNTVYVDCDTRTYSFIKKGTEDSYTRINYNDGALGDYPSLKSGINYIYFVYTGFGGSPVPAFYSPLIYPRWWKI